MEHSKTGYVWSKDWIITQCEPTITLFCFNERKCKDFGSLKMFYIYVCVRVCVCVYVVV